MAQQKLTGPADDLLSQLRDTEVQLYREVDALQEEVDKATKAHKPTIDALTRQRETLVDQLRDYYEQHGEEIVEPGTKTAFLRSGELSTRSTTALEVSDEDHVKAQLRAMGLAGQGIIRKVTTKLNLDWLKSRPSVVEQLEGVTFVTTIKLHIKPEMPQGTVVRDSKKLSVKLSST